MFLQDLYSKFLDKYGQFFVQYMKFRELVTVEPLMPDKNAISEIKKLEREGEEIAAAIEESQIQMDEEISGLAGELDKLEGEEKEETERNIENLRSSAALRKEEIEKREQARKSQIFSLAKRKKVSLDDERDYSKFRTDVYEKDFVDNPETKNKISSLLSAMITQIDQDNNWEATQFGVPSALGMSQLSNEELTT